MAHTVASIMGGFARGDLGALLSFSADGAGTVASNNIENIGDCPARGVVIGINTTAVGGSPSVVVTLQGVDKASGQVYTLLASAAITGTGFKTLTIFPAAPATANVSANAQLPASWNVAVTIGGTTPQYTGTIGASLLY